MINTMSRSTAQNWRQAEELLKAKGVRVTHQRLEVFCELMSSHEHPSAEEIYERVARRLPTISLDTVYRTIALFEEFGVIRRVEVLDDRARYDANLKPHHHLVCTRCKKIEDFYWPGFDRLKEPEELRKWGRLRSRHAEIRGLCRECAEKETE